MRIFRPSTRPKRKYTKEEKARRRAGNISFLHSKGYGLEMLNAKSDKYLWQICNRYQGYVAGPLGKIKRPKGAL